MPITPFKLYRLLQESVSELNHTNLQMMKEEIPFEDALAKIKERLQKMNEAIAIGEKDA